MMLLLDIGNSRVKWAVAQGRTLAPTVAVKHTGDPATVIGALPVDDVGTVWIAQVMGKDHERKIAAAVQERFGVFPHFARSAAQV
ncbi:MAG: type III pantothenate kinase, partial [Stenotrophobium sp.]